MFGLIFSTYCIPRCSKVMMSKVDVLSYCFTFIHINDTKKIYNEYVGPPLPIYA